MITTFLMGILGAAIAIHAICIATDIPEKVPLTFGLEAALMFAAGIATCVFAVEQDLWSGCIALGTAIGLQVVYILDARRQGYTVVGLVVKDYTPTRPAEFN